MSEFEVIGGSGEAMVVHYPEVRAGTCEYCGVIDNTKSADIQYQLCPHYRGKTIECRYCYATNNQLEVIRMSVIKVVSHPTRPGMKIAVCDRTDCVKKFQSEFAHA